MLKHTDVSAHEIRVFTLLEANPSRWFTNAQIATEARVCPRTARAHTLRLVKAGLVEVAEVFPGYRYRMCQRRDKRSAAHHQRLKAAQEVFGGME